MRTAICLRKQSDSAARDQMITADLDLERLLQDRMRLTSFSDAACDCRERVQAIRRVPFVFHVPEHEESPAAKYRSFSFCPQRYARARPTMLRSL